MQANYSNDLQVIKDHALIGEAIKIPINAPQSVMSMSPITLTVPGRILDMQMRVSAPVVGDSLPIILLSHGHGSSNNLSSLNGYGPLANFWAAHGFAVIQPTHLDSKTLSLDKSTPGAPIFWQSRAEDMKSVLDQLDTIESLVPFIAGRLDHSRIAVAGHSAGGRSASMLLGARFNDPDDATTTHNLIEPRIKAGVLMTAPGAGGSSLSRSAHENHPHLRHIDFGTMKTPALVVVGDADQSPMTTRDATWFADPYTLGPSPKHLLTLTGGGHILGGVSGYDVAETTDESPERVAVIQRLTWAYLRSQLYPGDETWNTVSKIFEGLSGVGTIESK